MNTPFPAPASTATLFLFAAVLLPFAAPANAQTPIAPLVVYETPPTFRASEILTPEQLSGPHHKVREDVATNGITNTYTIDSDFGVFVAHGNDMLPERIREIYAIAAIRQTKESDAYKKALAEAAKAPVTGVKNLVTDPGDTLKGMGKGAMRFMKGAGERVRTMSEEEETADDLKEYSGARRQLAGQFGVDPYSSNQVLQDEIASLAGATLGGTLTVKIATIAIPGGAGAAIGGLAATSELNAKLVSQGPYSLRTENRDRLRAMSIDDGTVDSFLNHPVLNPKHQTAIAISLAKLQGARARQDFLRMTMASQSEEDAVFFMRCADLMARYHQAKSPVLEVVDFHGMPACYTAEKKLVLPILLDYGSWTEIGDRLTRSFLDFTRGDLAIEGREWFITGTISPRAREEAQARGLVVTENAGAGAAN